MEILFLSGATRRGMVLTSKTLTAAGVMKETFYSLDLNSHAPFRCSIPNRMNDGGSNGQTLVFLGRSGRKLLFGDVRFISVFHHPITFSRTYDRPFYNVLW